MLYTLGHAARAVLIGFLVTAPIMAQPSARQADEKTTPVSGTVIDADSREPLPARLHIQGQDGTWFHAESGASKGSAVHYRKQPPNMPQSAEVHTTLSPHPFRLELPPGRYTFRAERGKEYVPHIQEVSVGRAPLALELPLRRWTDMALRGWYSGDTHVHRTLDELPNVLLAEDLNVALPLTYWVRESDEIPAESDARRGRAENQLILVDPTHVIYPMNTEYEIFSVSGRRHTLGAVFVLNHQTPLKLAAPPVTPIAVEARRQGALLDLDKHSWPWSLMLVPVMEVDLFELANNHLWQTDFGFTQWTIETVPEYMQVETNDSGFTEWGWTDFGFQAYYALLNCGFPLRVTAGTASGVHPVQLGFGRVYVHVDGDFTYEKWIDGLDAGRSFVTTGPMLQVQFNGKHPGHRIAAAPGADRAEVLIEGSASGVEKLERIEIIVNGRIAERVAPTNEPLPSGGYASRIESTLGFPQSSWVTVRCFERHPAGRVRFAHTNPVHIDVPGKPLRPRREEAAYLIRRMREELARNEEVLDDAALAEYRRALAAFEEIAATAR